MSILPHISSLMMGWSSRLNDDVNNYHAHHTDIMKCFIEADIRSLREAIDLIEEEIPDFEPDLTIREHIVKLLSHELTLEQFKQWFFTSKASLAEDDIVYSIKLLFAEYDHGDWTETEMYKMLRDELEKATVGEKSGIHIETGTSSVTTEIKA